MISISGTEGTLWLDLTNPHRVTCPLRSCGHQTFNWVEEKSASKFNSVLNNMEIKANDKMETVCLAYDLETRKIINVKCNNQTIRAICHIRCQHSGKYKIDLELQLCSV